MLGIFEIISYRHGSVSESLLNGDVVAVVCHYSDDLALLWYLPIRIDLPFFLGEHAAVGEFSRNVRC